MPKSNTPVGIKNGNSLYNRSLREGAFSLPAVNPISTEVPEIVTVWALIDRARIGFTAASMVIEGGLQKGVMLAVEFQNQLDKLSEYSAEVARKEAGK